MRWHTKQLILATVILLSFPHGARPALAQHDGDLAVFSTASQGGQLVLDGLPSGFVQLNPSFCAAGLCLWSATDPGFVTPSTAPSGLYPVSGSVGLRLEIVSIEAGAAVKVASTVLDAAGEGATLGAAPSLHVHPSWQLTLPSGTDASRTVTVRVTAPGGSHAASDSRSFLLSTTAETTTTTTSTSTTTLPEPPCGDCSVDSDSGEQCDEGVRNGGRGQACRLGCSWGSCADPDHSGLTTASDAAFLLRAAVRAAPAGLECVTGEPPASPVPCSLRVCDVDGNGKVTSSDALRALRFAVGQPATLACPDQ